MVVLGGGWFIMSEGPLKLINLSLGPLFFITFEVITPFARWSTSRSTKVNVPHAIKFRASCIADLVTHRGLPMAP